MKTLEDLAREACEAASLPPAITAHPGVKDALRRHAALVRAKALDEAAAVCDVTPPYPFRPSIEAAHAIRALKGVG